MIFFKNPQQTKSILNRRTNFSDKQNAEPLELNKYITHRCVMGLRRKLRWLCSLKFPTGNFDWYKKSIPGPFEWAKPSISALD